MKYELHLFEKSVLSVMDGSVAIDKSVDPIVMPCNNFPTAMNAMVAMRQNSPDVATAIVYCDGKVQCLWDRNL